MTATRTYAADCTCALAYYSSMLCGSTVPGFPFGRWCDHRDLVLWCRAPNPNLYSSTSFSTLVLTIWFYFSVANLEFLFQSCQFGIFISGSTFGVFVTLAGIVVKACQQLESQFHNPSSRRCTTSTTVAKNSNLEMCGISSIRILSNRIQTQR